MSRKIYRRLVLDKDGNILEEDSYQYTGPLSLCNGGGGHNSTIEKADPWKPIQPYLLYGAGEAYRLYNQEGPKMYPGEQILGYTPLEQAGMGGLVKNATETVAPMAQGMTNAVNYATSGKLLRPESNPALQAYMRSAVQPVFQGLTEQYLPAIRSGATKAGSYGGSRQGIAEALAAQRAMQTAGNITSGLAAKGYEAGLNATTKAMAMAPIAANLSASPYMTLSQVGQAQRDLAQARLNEQIKRYEYNQTLPYAKLAQYVNTVVGSGGGGQFKQLSSTSETAGRSTGSRVVGGLGGAAAGAAAGAMYGSEASVPGIVIGAIVGGLLGALS